MISIESSLHEIGQELRIRVSIIFSIMVSWMISFYIILVIELGRGYVFGLSLGLCLGLGLGLGLGFFQNAASLDIQFFHVGFLYSSLLKLKSETGLSVLKSRRIPLPKLVKTFATVSRALRIRFLVGSMTVLTAPSMTSAAPANGESGTW